MRLILSLALMLAANSATAREYPVGTGWSRAPDLSVYGALLRSSALAREQDILCSGRNPALVEDEWRSNFGAREAWIADALRARYGPAAVARLGAGATVGRITCPVVSDNNWRLHHHRMLRLLELRLVPRDHFRSPAP